MGFIGIISLMSKSAQISNNALFEDRIINFLKFISPRKRILFWGFFLYGNKHTTIIYE